MEFKGQTWHPDKEIHLILSSYLNLKKRSNHSDCASFPRTRYQVLKAKKLSLILDPKENLIGWT